MQKFLALWLLVVAFAIAIHLGTPPLFDADEGRNAEVAREMAETNDYVMPRLNALPYLDKPVVYFAAEAALMEVLGPTELAARLPAWLFTLATAAVVFWFARRVWGRETPWVASIVFLAMPLTVAFARTVIFDSALMFFTTLALAAFYFAIEGEKRWAVVAWLAMGFAMITKGPVVFILVLFVALPYAWKRRAMRTLFPLAGLVLFALVIAPWVWGVTKVVPEFLRYVLVTETVERMATKALKRTGPPWYFVPYVLGGALPWSFVALFNWKALRKRGGEVLYLVLWFAIPFVFFSISQSKRPQYILPLMPAIALLVARIWEGARVRATAVIVGAFGVLLLVAPLFLHRTKMQPEVAAVADQTAYVLGASFLVAGLVAFFSSRRELVLAALTIPMIVLPLASNPMMHAIGERRSAKAFVAELTPHLRPGSQIIGVEAFTGSMAFYLRRPITLVTPDASELTSNYLLRRYEKFASNPASTIKPPAYFERSLASGCEACVYVLRDRDATRRGVLEARGWKVVADNAHVVAYAR